MQQLNLFPQEQAEWCPDDWQTPNKEAFQMAQLVKDSDRYILEPCAGTGQIAKEILKSAFWATIQANELNRARFHQGKETFPKALWSQCDFLSFAWDKEQISQCHYDLIITNPPFSLCIEFIERSLSLLNPNNPDARLLFLLPLDWNSPKGRASQWKKLDAHIHHVYQIEGRVAYLDANGVPQKGRQCSDAVFDIRLGKKGSCSSYLGEGA